ncbi:MAG: 1,4-alpha-glucan branching enzyme [Lachnospiraceae bacterium]|nr:1,4-alpha-glucan branching enzyme [Lachnospiraceae bacterium]
MDRKLYRMMDWSRIEGIAYVDEDNPHDLLGGHYVKDGILIQAFFPGAKKVKVVVQISRSFKEYDMELMDEAGFFALLVRTDKKQKYHYYYNVEGEDGKISQVYDPYSFAPAVSEADIAAFVKGTHPAAYKFLGSHVKEIDGVKGTAFAVWAPNAVSASVVGDFNNWDGRIHQMRKLKGGVFEIFIPGVKAGAGYKFELRLKGQRTVLKRDPYAFENRNEEKEASVVYDSTFEFSDEGWLDERKQRGNKAPLSICEVSLDSFKASDDKGRPDYRSIAKELSAYVKDMGYTHVELKPVMEHADNAGDPYDVSCLYAPDSFFGSPDDLKFLVDYLHSEKTGVILDWVVSCFPDDAGGLSEFDGTCLYGHLDMKKRYNVKRDALNYNYARPEVSEYLAGNAFFWIDEYHVDGLRFDALDEMIYLDYGKKNGEWIPNQYGGKENIDAVEFLKRLNERHEERKDGSVFIAEGLKTWGRVTASVKEDGLGFDYKWDKGFTDDLTDYLSFDPFFRTHHYGELIYSFSYFASESFILPFSSKDVGKEGGVSGFLAGMPGGYESKIANLRAAFGMLVVHPGKFLNCFSADELKAGSESGDADKDKNNEAGSSFSLYLKELLRFYREHPALYTYDDDEKGFEWINKSSANENVLVFLRKSGEEKLLVILNFANTLYSDFKIGVPSGGKYKEIFNSDAVKYGGGGNTNPRVKASKKEPSDGRKDSIKIKMAPLSLSVFRCM